MDPAPQVPGLSSINRRKDWQRPLYADEQDISQDQIDTILADFIELGLTSDTPANVACRCTVFTKSDMIHLQNKGEKLEDIIYGLHVGNAMNYMSTIVSNRRLKEPMVFCGRAVIEQSSSKSPFRVTCRS